MVCVVLSVDDAYKRTLAAGFLSRYLHGSLPYVRRHITVIKIGDLCKITEHVPLFGDLCKITEHVPLFGDLCKITEHVPLFGDMCKITEHVPLFGDLCKITEHVPLL